MVGELKNQSKLKSSGVSGSKLVIAICLVVHVVIYFATFGFLFVLWFYSLAVGLVALASIAILTGKRDGDVFVRSTVLFNVLLAAFGILYLVQNYYYFYS